MPTNSQQDSRRAFFAVVLGDVEALTQFLVRGTDPNFGVECWPNTFRREFFTPLHAAAGAENVAAVRVLLVHGADVNAVSSRQRTALDLAESEPVRDLLLQAGGLTRWDLMSQRPVLGAAAAPRLAAALPRALTVLRRPDRTFALRDDTSGKSVIALPLTSPYAFDVRRRATWQPSTGERMYTDFDVGWKGEVWTVSGLDSPSGANQYPGHLEWVRNADAFQDGVFFPSRAWAPTASGSPAAGSLAEPWLAAGEPAVIPPPIQGRGAAGLPPPQEPPGAGETGP